MTNLACRPTRDANGLNPKEMEEGVPALLAKLSRMEGKKRESVLCCVGGMVGKSIGAWVAKNDTRKKKGKAAEKEGFGLMKWRFIFPPESGGEQEGSIMWVFVVPSTSGRVVQYQVMAFLTVARRFS
jgi:hypothetical protein